MKITYYIHDLEFPLVEGVRKQAWWMAQEMKKKGHEVEILSTSKRKERVEKEAIKIKYGSALDISKLCKTDLLHYVSHPSPLIVPLLLRAKAKVQVITPFDGGLNGFWKRSWDFLVSSLVLRRVSRVTLQTKYQFNLLQKTRLKIIQTKIIPPLISNLKASAKKSVEPTLLFMSHLSIEKGIGDVLKAFAIVREQKKGVKLIICDSGLKKNSFYYKEIKKINREDIIIKGKVDPQEELSKAWIYLYPIHKAQETFSVPLSLIEAMQVNTKYISTNVGGLAQYFPEEYLIAPKRSDLLAAKIIEMLSPKSKILPLIQKIDNKKTIQELERLYYELVKKKEESQIKNGIK